LKLETGNLIFEVQYFLVCNLILGNWNLFARLALPADRLFGICEQLTGKLQYKHIRVFRKPLLPAVYQNR